MIKIAERVARSPVSLRLEGRTFFQSAVLVSVALIVLTPLVFLVINSFQVSEPRIAGGTYWGLDGWRAAFTEPGIRKALINTLTITIVRQSIAIVVVIFFVWLLTRTDMPGRDWAEFGFWLTFFLPTLPALLGWILLLHPSYGVVNTQLQRLWFIDGPVFNIYSYWGIVWVHLVAGTIAIKVVLLAPAFRNMDASLEEASRVCGVSTIGTLRRVIVPIMLPAILVVTLMSMVTSFQAFEIELVLGARPGIDVFSTLVFKFVKQEPSLPGQAAALSILVMAFMVPLVVLQQRVIRKRIYSTVTGQYKSNRTRLGRWRWPAFVLVASFIFISTVLPLSFLAVGTFMKLFGYFELADPYTLRNWKRVFDDPIFLLSIKNTLILGAWTAVIAVSWFSLVAYVIVRTRFKLRTTLDFISWLPWAVPGILLALGLMWTILGIPILRPLHASTFVLVIAIVMGTITVAVQMFKTVFLQIGRDLEEASAISGASWWYTYRRVLLPILAPTLVVVGLVAFVAAVKDVARMALLAGSGNRPLSLLQLDFMVSDNMEAATVVGLIVTLIIVVVAFITRAVSRRVGLLH